MIYLVKSNDKLKVGYTANFKKRMEGYRSHNPDIEIINMKAGSREDEKALHDELGELNVIGEWYLYSQYIIDTFENYVIKDESLKEEIMRLKLEIIRLSKLRTPHQVNELTKQTITIELNSLDEFYELELNSIEDKSANEVLIKWRDKILYHRVGYEYIISNKLLTFK